MNTSCKLPLSQFWYHQQQALFLLLREKDASSLSSPMSLPSLSHPPCSIPGQSEPDRLAKLLKSNSRRVDIRYLEERYSYLSSPV